MERSDSQLIYGRTNRWISSWLCDRQQRFVLDGSSSLDSPVPSGVPQGTVLGPLMFLLYVNGIAAKVSPQTTVKLFADDCLLYRTIESVADSIQLQQDLDIMVDWSNTWLMRFNASKCHLLKIKTTKQKCLPTVYNIKGQLQEVDHHPYLGRLDLENPHQQYHQQSKQNPRPATSPSLQLQPGGEIQSLHIPCPPTSWVFLFCLGPISQARYFDHRKSPALGCPLRYRKLLIQR